MVKNAPRMMFVQRFMLSFSVRVRKGMNTAISTMIANSVRNSFVISMPATTPSIRSSIMPGSINEIVPADKPMSDVFHLLFCCLEMRQLCVVCWFVIYGLWA